MEWKTNNGHMIEPVDYIFVTDQTHFIQTKCRLIHHEIDQETPIARQKINVKNGILYQVKRKVGSKIKDQTKNKYQMSSDIEIYIYVGFALVAIISNRNTQQESTQF